MRDSGGGPVTRSHGLQRRIDRIAWAVHLTPLLGGADLVRANDGRWWLISCAEGDQPLPHTQACETSREAVEQMESLLAAPEWGN